MRRGMVLLTFMVAAILLCTHLAAMAQHSQLTQVQGVELAEGIKRVLSRPAPDCKKFLLCVKVPYLNCITDCCDSFKPTLPHSDQCDCWYVMERDSRDNLISLQNYCGFKKPTNCSRWEEKKQQEVEAAKEEKKSIRKLQKSVCCEKDKEKIKSCMLKTTSLEQCCPAFKIMLAHNCDCYNYANDLDNQFVIVIESFCDVTNPCTKLQAM